MGKSKKVAVLECEIPEGNDYYVCRDLATKRYYRFVDSNEYDTALSMIAALADMGTRDADMLINYLKNWGWDGNKIIDEAVDCIDEVGREGGFYCVLKSLKEAAEEEIIDEARSIAEEILGDEANGFDDWLRENLDETELDYNYIAWGCASEPEEGMCDLLRDTMENGEVPEDKLEKLIERWKEEYLGED